MPPSSKSSSKSKALPPLFNPLVIALLLLNAAGFFVLFFKTEVDNLGTQQEVALVRNELMASNPQRDSGVELADIPKRDSNYGMVEEKEFSDWDIVFKYPDDLFLALVNDASTIGQKNVRLTTSKGSLFHRDEFNPTPRKGEFINGYQIDLYKLDAAQYPLGSEQELTPTDNPLVQKISTSCDGDGVGCSYAQYLITTENAHYLVNAHTGGDYDSTFLENDLSVIISSIKEK